MNSLSLRPLQTKPRYKKNRTGRRQRRGEQQISAFGTSPVSVGGECYCGKRSWSGEQEEDEEDVQAGGGHETKHREQRSSEMKGKGKSKGMASRC